MKVHHAALTSLVLFLSSLRAFVDSVPPACHNGAAATSSKTKLADIDTNLTALYASLRKKDAGYEENCTYDVTYNGLKYELALLFERFELNRSNYERGLWGHCGDEGATQLITDIAAVTTLLQAPGNTTICDRSKLLGCHQKYNKCMCLVDNKNFRNIVADHFKGKDKRTNQQLDQCVLQAGSDCPFQPNTKYLCVPGTECLYKEDKKSCKLRQGWSMPPAPSSNSFRFSRSDYSNIYCQCYGYSGACRGRTPMTSAWGLAVVVGLVSVFSAFYCRRSLL